jgi:hypothetical protein
VRRSIVTRRIARRRVVHPGRPGRVAPLLVIASWLLIKPITLVLVNPLDLFAIAGTAFIVNTIASDGEAT